MRFNREQIEAYLMAICPWMFGSRDSPAQVVESRNESAALQAAEWTIKWEYLGDTFRIVLYHMTEINECSARVGRFDSDYWVEAEVYAIVALGIKEAKVRLRERTQIEQLLGLTAIGIGLLEGPATAPSPAEFDRLGERFGSTG